MDRTTPEPAVRRRRRVSLSVRRMLILVLVLGGLLGWPTRRAARQRKAVAAVEALGGRVIYDWQPEPGPDPPGFAPATVAHPPGPAWLRTMLGDEYFQEVIGVVLPDTDPGPMLTAPSPAAPREGPEWQAYQEQSRREQEAEAALDRDQLACLEGLDRIESLDLYVSSLKPESLTRLGELTRLKQLHVLHAPIDARGLEQIGRLTKLERLTVALRLGDEAPLGQLERLPALERLEIIQASPRINPAIPAPATGPKPLGTSVTDACLARLGRLRSLIELSIQDGSPITDAGLAHLMGLERLERLDLGGRGGSGGADRITDAGLAYLARLGNLRQLILPDAREIGDAGLAHLSGLVHLEQLLLNSSAKITDAGVAHLEGLRKLDWLRLDAAELLTGATVRSLAKLPVLRALDFNVRSIPGPALIELGNLPSLEFATFSGAKVPRAILQAIATRKPRLDIEAEIIDEGTDAANPATSPDVPRGPE